MRCATEPGGWQANNVAVLGVGLVDDPERVRVDDLGGHDAVHVAARVRGEDDLVARRRAGRGRGSPGCG